MPGSQNVVLTALQFLGWRGWDRQPQALLLVYEILLRTACFWCGAQAKNGNDPLLPQSNSYDGFLKELKASLDQHLLPDRALWWVFRDGTDVHPLCNGDWMEFGVRPQKLRLHDELHKHSSRMFQTRYGPACRPPHTAELLMAASSNALQLYG